MFPAQADPVGGELGTFFLGFSSLLVADMLYGQIQTNGQILN